MGRGFKRFTAPRNDGSELAIDFDMDLADDLGDESCQRYVEEQAKRLDEQLEHVEARRQYEEDNPVRDRDE